MSRQDKGNPILKVSDLHVSYGKIAALKGISFEVYPGEIVSILGANGAGKTTTFYMTTGLIAPYEGRIFLNDLDITKYPVYKRAQNGIGYLAQ